MRTIQVDDAVFSALAARVSGFNQTPNDVLRKLLLINDNESEAAAPVRSATDPILELLAAPAFAAIREAEGRYLAVLGALYRNNAEGFASLERYGKGKRTYFSKSPERIRQGKQQYGAKPIPGTPYFTLTTLDNAAKRKVLQFAMTAFGHPDSTIEKVLSTLPSHSRTVASASQLRGS